MRRRLALLVCGLWACSDAARPPSAPGAIGGGAAGSGSAGQAEDAGGDDAGAAGTTCGLVDAPSAPGCGPDALAAYTACTDSACAAEYASCFGTGFRSGSFSGPCRAYGVCRSRCDCAAAGGCGTCAPSADCRGCAEGFARCALPCAELLRCDGGVADGGLGVADAASGDAGSACAELASCCAGLGPPRAEECTQMLSLYASAGVSGAQGCSVARSAFCP